MFGITDIYVRWSKACLYLCSIFVVLLMLSFSSKAFAATTEIIATVSPVREIVVDSNNNLVEVYSNTGLDVFPVVHIGTINGKIIPMNQATLKDYKKVLKNMNFSKYGLVYKKQDKKQKFSFPILITIDILTNTRH